MLLLIPVIEHSRCSRGYMLIVSTYLFRSDGGGARTKMGPRLAIAFKTEMHAVRRSQSKRHQGFASLTSDVAMSVPFPCGLELLRVYEFL